MGKAILRFSGGHATVKKVNKRFDEQLEGIGIVKEGVGGSASSGARWNGVESTACIGLGDTNARRTLAVVGGEEVRYGDEGRELDGVGHVSIDDGGGSGVVR